MLWCHPQKRLRHPEVGGTHFRQNQILPRFRGWDLEQFSESEIPPRGASSAARASPRRAPRLSPLLLLLRGRGEGGSTLSPHVVNKARCGLAATRITPVHSGETTSPIVTCSASKKRPHSIVAGLLWCTSSW